MVDSKIINYLIEALKANEQKITPYDASAEVVRVEDGIAWIHIPGGVDETPAFMSVSAQPGDSVRVRVANGQAWISGNETAPPTDDRVANVARAEAATASEQASQALDDATRAQTAADVAEAAATVANTAANDALTQLSTVQDVVGIVEWAATHTEEDMATYILSHLALTDAGLFVLKDDSGYKLLVKNDGVDVIDPQGHVVSSFGENIVLDSSRPQYIGGQQAYIKYYDSNGDHIPDSLEIRANSIVLGGTDIEERIDSAVGLVYDHTYSETNSTYTFTASLYYGGEDVTATADPDRFVWYLRTEAGDTLLGRGVSISVAESVMGYRASILGGYDEEPLEEIFSTDTDDVLVDENNDYLIAYVEDEIDGAT